MRGLLSFSPERPVIYTLLAYKEWPVAVSFCLEANKDIGITYLSEQEMYNWLPFLETESLTIQQKSDLLRYYLLANEKCWWLDATVEVRNTDIFTNASFELAERHDQGSVAGVGVENFWDLETRITADNFIEQSLTSFKQKIYGVIFENLKRDLLANANRDYLYTFFVKKTAYKQVNYFPKFDFVSMDTAEAMGLRGDDTHFIKHTAKVPDFMSEKEQNYLNRIERRMQLWLGKS